MLSSAAHILKLEQIQRGLAWPLRKDDTQIREAFHIKKKKNPGEIKVKLYYSIYEMIDAVDLNN